MARPKVSPAELDATWLRVRAAYLEVIGRRSEQRARVEAGRIDALYEAHRPQRERNVERYNCEQLAREDFRRQSMLRTDRNSRRNKRRRVDAEVLRLRRERQRMAREERLQRAAEARQARRAARERRREAAERWRMAREDRGARRGPRPQRSAEVWLLRAARLLARWCREDRRFAARRGREAVRAERRRKAEARAQRVCAKDAARRAARARAAMEPAREAAPRWSKHWTMADILGG